MDFLELVNQRESCRRFSQRAVPREVLDHCLEAARLAPSACNAQPWTFLVLDRDPVKARALDAATRGVYQTTAFIREAPAVIVVKTDRATFATKMGGMLRGIQYSLVDIGIACEHLVLAAAEQGLDSCWIGWFDEKNLKKAMGLSKSDRIDVILALGYRSEGLVRRSKIRKSLTEIRRYFGEE
jgi:nitroreductase